MLRIQLIQLNRQMQDLLFMVDILESMMGMQTEILYMICGIAVSAVTVLMTGKKNLHITIAQTVVLS